MNQIKVQPPTAERLDELCRIMARSNCAAKRAAAKIVGNRKYRLFRAALRGEAVEGLTSDQLATIQNFSEDRGLMLEVETIRNEVIEAVIPAMVGVANKFAFFHPDHEDGDYFGEATIIAVEAIYGYTNPAIKFITYLRRTLIYELTRYVRCNRAYALTSHSSHFLNLLAMVLETTEVLEKQGQSVSYHSIRERIKPLCLEKQSLRGIDIDEYLPGVMTFICSGSDVADSNPKVEDRNDYTSDVACRADNNPARIAELNDFERDLMQSINPLERSVLECRMAGLTLSQAAAKNEINVKKAKLLLNAALVKIERRLRHHNNAA